MRWVDLVQARLKGNLFLKTQPGRCRSSTIKKSFDYMRRVENGLAHLQSWLVFLTRVKPLEESWFAHVITYPGTETGCHMRSGLLFLLFFVFYYNACAILISVILRFLSLFGITGFHLIPFLRT